MPPLKPHTLRLPVLSEPAAPSPEPARSLGHDDAEFAPGTFDAPEDGLPRRRFLQLASATLATAGLTACYRMPPEKLMPYTRRPPHVTPGVPLQYATVFTQQGYGVGMVVESWQGHPTKVEGNPDHPWSLGAASAQHQAQIRQLYYPYRGNVVFHRNEATSWKRYLRESVELAKTLERDGGEGLCFLLEPSASPLLASVRERIRARFPKAEFFAWDPAGRDQVYEGARLAFGEPVETVYDFKKAKVVASFGSDFLARGPTHLRDARHFAEARDPKHGMNRLYVAEAGFSLTGMFADHRVRAKPTEVEALALALIREVARTGEVPELSPFGQLDAFAPPPAHARWLQVLAKDLVSSRPHALVLAGEELPPLVHAAAHLLNHALGREATTHHKPLLHDASTGPVALARLTERLVRGEVRALVMTAWNPVWTAPVDLAFAAALKRCPHVVYTSLWPDQTMQHATWYVPASHPLEAWGDARAPDGTVSLQQPLVEPLFRSFTEFDVLSPFARLPDVKPHDALRSLWQALHPGPDFEERWEEWLALGVIPGTKAPEVSPAPDAAAVAERARAVAPRVSDALEVRFVPDYKLYDGRYFVNAWLQELPDPVTKVTWGNAALISPATAASLGVRHQEIVTLQLGERQVQGAVFVLPGHADGAVSISLGYGQPAPEPTDRVAGFNAYALRTTQALWYAPGLSVRGTGEMRALAITQEEGLQHGREIAIQRTLDEFQEAKGHFLHHLKGPVEKLYDPFSYVHEGYKWAMAIDLNRCTGCSACVVACQAENNIPVVGAQKVIEGRTMHWLRIDRYFSPAGPTGDVTAITQPLMCVHCETAPCEYVCPVNATLHSDEGVNQMVYNRCIGTRFCSNNCPYKVRRFNWGDYQNENRLSETEKMLRNPQVTVRHQGVMEKCTWCVQRMERARIEARIERREINTAVLQTACQQTCPTRAIVFGSLHVEDSPVATLHRDERHYELLHELGTRPRTVHLARLKNPHPELAG